MAQFALPPTDKHPDPPTVVDGEVIALVDIAPASPVNLPAVRAEERLPIRRLLERVGR